MHIAGEVCGRYHVQVRTSLELWTEAYSEPCQTSKMEHFAKIINGF